MLLNTKIYPYLVLILFLTITPTHAFNLTEKLDECQSHLNANRLTTGRGGTALVCYEAVLKQDPTNSEAWQGLDQIKARYNILINRASNRGQEYKVEAYQKRIGLVDNVKTRIEAIQTRLRQEDELEKTRLKTLLNTPTTTKPEVFVQLGHSDFVYSVAFSPDGKLALSGSEDNSLKLWQVSTGRELRTFKGHSDSVYSVAFSPDGRLALSGSSDSTLKLWEVSSGRDMRTFKGHSRSVLSVAFSPDGQLALSGSEDNSLKLWQVSTGRELRTFKGHSRSVGSVAFSPDGKLALSGSADNSLKLWQVSTGRELRTFKGHSFYVRSVAFSPDGKLALSGCWGGSLKLWQVSTGRELRTVKEISGYVYSVALSPDGKLALSGSLDHSLKLWQVSTGRELRTFKGHSRSVRSVAFSPDGKLAWSDSYELKLWQVSTGRKLRTFYGHSSGISSVAFSPDGKLALSGSEDNSLKLWQVSTGRELRTFKGHSYSVYSMAFSPDGKLALSGSWGRLKLWQVSTGRELRTFYGHPNNVTSVAFSPDGKLALSGSWYGSLKLWQVSTGRELRTFKGHSLDVESVAFSPSGKLALSGSDESTLKLWEVASGRELRTFKGHSTQVKSVAFSPDGKLALSGSRDKTLKLWEVASGRELRTFKGHSNIVWSVAFSPSGKLAFSGSSDTTTRLWNIQTGKEVAQMVAFDNDEWVTITPEGYYTASLNGAKHINVRVGDFDIYSIDQYEAIYHRPDIVKLAIKLGDTQQAIAKLSHGAAPVQIVQVQAPKVWFVTPQNGYETYKTSIEVEVKTENVADAADLVKFFNNGRPVSIKNVGKRTRPTAVGAKVRTYTQKIPLVIGENRIYVEVRGKAGAVQRTPIQLIVRKGVIKKLPDLYYLGIGVAEHPQIPLKFPAVDVIGLEKVLKQQKGKAYQQVVTKTLTNQEATSFNIINTMLKFFEPAKQGDIAILFISGHGMNTRMGYYFVTYDAEVDHLAATGVDWNKFNIIYDLGANVLLLADTCHSGNITNNKWKKQAKVDPNEILRQANNHNVVVFASSSGKGFSIEDPKWGHGAFTKALIDGLSGEAAYRKGVVKLSFLQDYVRDKVRELTDNAQIPTIPDTTGSGDFFDFVLARE